MVYLHSQKRRHAQHRILTSGKPFFFYFAAKERKQNPLLSSWHTLYLNVQMHYGIQPQSIQEIEAVRNPATRFVKSIKGHHGITEP